MKKPSIEEIRERARREGKEREEREEREEEERGKEPPYKIDESAIECCFCNRVLSGRALRLYLVDELETAETFDKKPREPKLSTWIEEQGFVIEWRRVALHHGVTLEEKFPDRKDARGWLEVARGHEGHSEGACEWVATHYENRSRPRDGVPVAEWPPEWDNALRLPYCAQCGVVGPLPDYFVARALVWLNSPPGWFHESDYERTMLCAGCVEKLPSSDRLPTVSREGE